MTATQEEIPYCSPTTSSGKQKKARSTSQPHFCSENTPATIEADEFLLDLQQLATNSNSSNFNNNISRISKLPKSLTTTMPTFDGKSEKFEMFEDRLQTSLKIHNQLMEEDKPAVNWFSRWTPEIGKRHIRSCSSSDHRAIHLCQNASPPEKLSQPGALGEWHVWTACVASWKGVRTEWFGSSRRNAHNHCDATSPNQRATIAKNQVTIKISAVNSNERKIKPEIIRIVPAITMVVPKQTLTPTTKLTTIPKRTK